MLFHALSGFVGLSVMRDVGCGGMKPGAHIIDPDARLGAKQQIGGHEPNLGKLLLQVFVDDRRLVNNTVAGDQHRHLAVGILSQQIFGLVLEIDLDELVRDLFFGQDNPRPVGVGSGVAGVKLHGAVLLMRFVLTILERR